MIGESCVRTRIRLWVSLLVFFGLGASAILLVVAPPGGAAAGSPTATYSATVTIPVPPASSFAGSGGGDGWAVAMTPTAVYNVFHHDSVLQVACHLQTDASPCWDPKTITDAGNDAFATSGQPGMWLDQASGRLYVFATRSSDATGGVVCIDTTQPAGNRDPFCGFTPLTAAGDAAAVGAISNPVAVASRWYAFNYVPDAGATGTKNKLLCFDLTTFAPCANQPFSVAIGSGPVADSTSPPPAVTAIGSHVIVPVKMGSADELGCFDGQALGDCAGSWPVTLDFNYDSSNGAAFPLLDASGAVTGLCLPSTGDPCFSLAGASVSTPQALAPVITPNTGWDGPAVVLGPRVYVPNGNDDHVECYDYSTSASCVNFPKSLPNLSLLYTVNPDPGRPTCIWVNADGGSGQIQNFDAYSAGGCGQGPIRVLASSVVVPTPVCMPTQYTSLQVLAPARGTYTSGSVGFQDADGNPIPGIAAQPLDNTGSAALTGLNLSPSTGLPQFLITLVGEQGTPGSVQVRLTWIGTDDPSCVKPGTHVTPAVTALNPSSGPTTGGTAVTLTGTDFAGATAVSFGSATATGVTVVSPTQITATAPAGTGTVDVTVTTPDGTSSSGPGDRYTYVPGTAGQPRTATGAPKVLSSSSAVFTATINPDGLPTTMHFEYKAQLSGASATAITYDARTPEQTVGSDFADHTVTAKVAGLLPNITYHVRAVAANASGVAPSADATFKTATDPPPPRPVLGKSVNATPISGTVLVLLPGKGHISSAAAHASAAKGVGFVPLTEARQLPVGTIFDTSGGAARLTSATAVKGALQSGAFSAGVFKLLQDRRQKGLTELDLVEGRSATAKCAAPVGKAGTAARRALPTTVLNLLRASAKGKFKTRGKFSSATVRGTLWTTSDRCDGTLTAVTRGVVVVSDLRRKRQIVLRAGRSYLAKAP